MRDEPGQPLPALPGALQTGNPLLAWAACGELQQVKLEDALALVLLLGRAHDANFQKGCARWVARYMQQTRCDALEAELLRASLVALAGASDAQSAARQTLRELIELHGLSSCVEALQRAHG